MIRIRSGVFAGLVLVAGCPKSEAPGGATSSTAEVRWVDGGPGPELVVAGKSVALPAGDLAANARPPIFQDESGKRLSYATQGGDVRLVYKVGDEWFVGPKAKAPIDFKAAPDLDHAYGPLFETAPKRDAFVAEVKRGGGEPALVKLLNGAAYVDAPEWEKAFAELPEPRQAEVNRYLAALLEPGAPTGGLRRAVVHVPLRDPAKAPRLFERLKQITSDTLREPRAAAAILRALASTERDKAGAVACEILGKKPTDTANAKGTPQEIDAPGREALVDAAMLAIAHATLAGAGAPCKDAEGALGDDLCQPWFRCGPQGPLDGRETTKQDEPLCTKPEIVKAIDKELERPPAEVVSIAAGTRPSFYAFALLVAGDHLPEKLTAAHARRKYAIGQPKEPSCESGVAVGTACRCEEAILRDQACRHEAGSVSVGVCKFVVDDKTKKIDGVVATAPP